ncbi:hypothetical protein [Shewanella surugensis]|uniref:C2H2-type domain-containing protein n=1 Tax=Shewanella surugensis TaxID=212020 RepID=A0ABT0L9S4_9GAMM|nr:hypothetical protein [Shewanella surugensis]MCL1124436.1 hypothetical protein [Shewanella surugensis]
MRHCRYCNQSYDEKETRSPHCTTHNSDNHLSHEEATLPDNKKKTTPYPSKNMTPMLALGIFFFPIIFAWLTLQKGYSDLSKTLALSWLGVFILAMLINLSVVNATHIKHPTLLQQSHPVITPIKTNKNIDKNQSRMELK